MGIKKAMQIAMSGMIDAMKAQHSDAPQGFWDKFQKEMDSDEFITLLIPVYDKYYTMDDLKAVNAFYSSPAGQHMVANMGPVAEDSRQIGEKYGMKLGDEGSGRTAKRI